MPKIHTRNEHGFSEQESHDLEKLIDARGIKMVLQEISEICGLKADHVTHDWQDVRLAKAWATAQGAVGVASTQVQDL